MTSLVRTGVGSLPHRDPNEAAAFVLATTDVPYLPQLPNRHPEEAMLLQWGDGLAGAGPSDQLLAADRPMGPRSEGMVGAETMLGMLDGGVVKRPGTGSRTPAEP